MIIEFILVILIIVIFSKILSDSTEGFGNIGTEFYKGLSKYQTGENDAPDSQILKPNTMPNLGHLSKNLLSRENKRIDTLKKINKINKITDEMNIDKILSNKRKNKHNSKVPCKTLNKFFVESQFNNSYRDVLTAFNYICPDQKNLFNLQALPVTISRYTNNNVPVEFIKLISQFMNRANDEIKKLPDSYEIVNNYNNYMPLTSQLKKYTENKGINIFYKSIGVDFSLYPDLPENSPIELIDIISITKEFTEAETKYIATIAVKKILESVSDQLKITVHFIVKNNSIDNCNMFEMCTSPQNINSYQKVAIEFIFIDGFYTNDFNIDYDCMRSDTSKKVSNIDDDKYYSYSELGKDNMLDRHEIIKEFNSKLRQHEVEKNNFDINVPYPVYEQGKLEKINPRNNF
jgi:hypothetical protein